MTRSEILKAAHEVARRERRYFATYREALAEGLKAVHATLRAAPVTCGFQIREPWYKRTVWEQRGAGWRLVA
jgi:hypothetical protein